MQFCAFDEAARQLTVQRCIIACGSIQGRLKGMRFVSHFAQFSQKRFTGVNPVEKCVRFLCMSNGSHIRAVSGEDNASATEAAHDESLELSEDLALAEDEIDYELSEPSSSLGWIIPAVAVLAILAWTGFFAWANQDAMLGGASAQQWTGWITAWAIPTLLVVALWMLAMRSSTREARRFAEAAALLSRESADLEQRLHTVNRELSLAREFLTTQSRELEYLGRSASERISEHADRLQTLVHDNSAQVESIAGVSSTALENMEKLRENLPVIATSSRDVSNQIGAAGRTAKAQLSELVAGFQRLNEFGEASERQVSSLKDRIDAALGELDTRLNALEGQSSGRFDAMREESETFRAELDTREVEALTAIRTRAEALRTEFADLAAAQAEEENETLASLRERFEGLRNLVSSASAEINEAGATTEALLGNQIDALRGRLETMLEEVSALDQRSLDASNAKLQALVEEAEGVDQRLGQREQLFNQKLAERQASFDELEEQALASIDAHLASLDARIEERRVAQLEHMTSLEEQAEALGTRLEDLSAQMGAASDQGVEAGDRLASGLASLRETLGGSRDALDGTAQSVSQLTDASVRLLELIQASATHSRENLPQAIADFEARLEEVGTRTDSLRETVERMTEAGGALSETVAAADNRSREAMQVLESFGEMFRGTLGEQAEVLDSLGERLEGLNTQTEALASKSRDELAAALAELETRSAAALETIETGQATRIRALASKVGDASAKAIDKAVEAHTDRALSSLEEASQRASESSRQAIGHLRDQLAKVNELAGNLENRVVRAREQAEEQKDNDFSRRVALITESLNSNAIDIGKALSTDVTDTAWTSYLRGDRGIFTRRSVRLLENTEAREIAELYDADPDFRENVSRYIHDFEAMLRTLLSTRDGNALGVTVLSSDVGKLYVALAQAIERLRE